MKLGRKIALSVTGVTAVLGFGIAAATTTASANPGDPVPANPDWNKTAEIDGDATSGTAQRNSRGKVSVENGKLILENVPDFNFGITADKQNDQTNLPLFNNKADGTGSNILRVTDSRNGDKDGKSLGYTVSANAAQFQPDNGVAMPDGNWAINLNKTNAENSDGAIAPNVNKATLNASNSPATQGADANVISALPGTAHGTSTVNYSAGQDPYAATLSMPAKTNPATYHSTLTWTLNAAAPTDANK